MTSINIISKLNYLIILNLFFLTLQNEIYAQNLKRKEYIVCYWEVLYLNATSEDKKIIFSPKEEAFKTSLIEKCGESPFKVKRDKNKIYLKLKNNKLIRY